MKCHLFNFQFPLHIKQLFTMQVCLKIVIKSFLFDVNMCLSVLLSVLEAQLGLYGEPLVCLRHYTTLGLLDHVYIFLHFYSMCLLLRAMYFLPL